jgi:uncharacterized membrane protein YoaK (UPF0700 family)
MRQKLIKTALLLVIAIFVFNVMAYAFYWYASVWWYDMAMHTAGGLFLALLAGAVFERHILSHDKWRSIVLILLTVFIIGLSWEYFEYVVQFFIKSVSLAAVTDSVSDLICDMVGGIIGAIFVLHEKKRYNRGHGTIKNA